MLQYVILTFKETDSQFFPGFFFFKYLAKLEIVKKMIGVGK